MVSDASPTNAERVAVLGSGGMGTAMAVLLARAVGSVALCARDPELARVLASSRENPKHLPGAFLPPQVEPTHDPAEALRGAELVVVAVPSAYVRATLSSLARHVPGSLPVLSVVKGIENETFLRPSQVMTEILGQRPIAVMSGPSHAEEMVRGLPTSVVVAGADVALNARIQALMNRERFRVYTNQDLVGVELAGALKNILGIAAGICEGLGFGDNAKAALLTRGLVEMSRFAMALGGQASTFAGLAGVGDVITTCYSAFGRNRAVGLRVARGEGIDRIVASMTDVAEGVPTTRSVHAMALQHRIEMPITREVHGILFEGKPPLAALTDLMLRPPKVEWS